MPATTKEIVISTPGCSLKSSFKYILYKEADIICMEHQAENCKLLGIIKCPLKLQSQTLSQTFFALTLSLLTLKSKIRLSTKTRLCLS